MIILLNWPDTAMDKNQEMEVLLAAQVDAGRSPFEAALAGLISAGGKRLRPRIALLAGAALGAEPQALLNLAAAIEMLHTASLIHDDLVDGALFRRGVETLNARWSSAASVLTGDLAFTRAAALVQATHSFEVVDMFTRTMNEMVEGEVIHLAPKPRPETKEEYFRWIGAKTASLFELAASAPVLLAGASEQTFAAARRFGYNTGMAFQIVDDALDYTGDPQRLGKPAGSDLCQGTLTLPAHLYLDDHPEDKEFQKVLRREHMEEPALAGLIERVRRSPAIDRSLVRASRFINEALDGLTALPDGPERFALAEIALEIVEREA